MNRGLRLWIELNRKPTVGERLIEAWEITKALAFVAVVGGGLGWLLAQSSFVH
jgi:hypothetical protein